MLNWEEIREAFQKICKRAMIDKDFRELCLKDAAQAVRLETGMELPAGYTVRFIQNEGVDNTFVLPDFQKDPSELNDSDFDVVAGAKCAATCGATAACIGDTGLCAISCGASCLETCLCIGIPTVTGA